MATINIRSTISVIVILSCVNLTHAQRLGVKPFIGANYNSLRIINHDNLLFTDVGLGHVRPLLGIMLSYQITPKWVIEAGQLNSPTDYSYKAFHPDTKNNIAIIHSAFNQLSWILNSSYTFKEYSHFKYKIIGGLEFPINKRIPIIGSVYKPSSADTNFVTLTGVNSKPFPTMNKFQEIFKGFTLGIGQDFLVKKKTVAELRFCLRYDFSESGGTSIGFKKNGVLYVNQIVDRRATFNLTLIFNLSTILGSKWKE